MCGLLGGRHLYMYHLVHMLHSPAVQLGRSQGPFLPSQVQTASLHHSTQTTVPLTQPTVTASTNLTPPEMTTPPEPHMVTHTGMSLVTELLTNPVVLFPSSGGALRKRTVGSNLFEL